MDFGLLPPEVNSARIYAGPGSGPLVAAAAAWEALAAELQSTVSSYQSTIAGLTVGTWTGPSSASMATAVARYVAWMRIAAAQGEQTAKQAIAAAAAYDAAFKETVPPPVVAANRARLMALVTTNFFGQNTPAIAVTETHYAEMWAQDAAMYAYAGSAASATILTPFDPPTSSTKSGGQAGQAVAVAQATGTSAGNVQSTVASAQQAFSAVPNALSNLATPAVAAQSAPVDVLNVLADLSALFVDPELSAAGIAIDAPLGITALPYDIGGFYTGIHTR